MNERYKIKGEQEMLTREYGIHFGVPINHKVRDYNTGYSHLNVPNFPHIFLGKEVSLYQPINIAGDTKQMKLGNSLDNVMVMIGHGISKANDEWVFVGSNKSVYETTKAYEQFAENTETPHLDLIIACYTARNLNPVDQNQATIPFKQGIKIPYIVSGSNTIVKTNDGKSLYVPGEGAIMTVFSLWGGKLEWSNIRQHDRPDHFPEWAKNPV